jgi:hypothetical protein
MTKLATSWTSERGSDLLENSNSGFSLLLEDGFKLLLEDGGDLLLEDNELTPKAATEYTDETKESTAWQSPDGFTKLVSGIGEAMLTEASEVRVTEDGDPRHTEDVRFDPKNRTAWND